MVKPVTRSLQETIRTVPDFPKKGILFRDITTLLKDPDALASAAEKLTARFAAERITTVAAVESRGFILGGILADRLHAGFVPIRKPGKLPAATLRQEYTLEYGTDALEIHRDAITPGARVLLHDDLLATGGTAAAACRLVTALGGRIVCASFLIELTFLKGRELLRGIDVFSLVRYETEDGL